MSNTRRFFWLSRLDYIFVLRPMLFFPGWTTLLAGYFIADKAKLYTFYIYPSELDYFFLFRLMFGFALLMGSAFILNQLADVESDRRNDKLYLISDGHIPRDKAKKEAIILAIAGMLIGLSCSFRIAFLFLLFILITGYFYNFYPLKLKDRPWGSLLANVSMGWLAFMIGWAGQAELSRQLIIDSIPYVLFNTALYLYTLLPDIRGDRMAGKKTLAVIYGYEKLMLGAIFAIAFGLFSIFWLRDLTSLVFYMLSMPLILKTMYFMEIPDAIRSTKFGILFFSISMCLKWPLYFVLMVLGFFATKLYFKKRFYQNYPNFSGL
jgi:4-hydroxybenzoate polyprenyltransferase